MKIQSITIKGLKGAQGRLITLDPVVFFSGPNGAGKSTVIDGIRLLCRGEHPDAGRGGTPARRGDDIMTLAAGDEIEVEAAISAPDGVWVIGRRWARTRAVRGADSGKVTVSESAWARPPVGRRIDKKAEAEAAIQKLVGAAAGLDLSELLGPKVTDSDRRRLLLTAAGSRSTWTPEVVAAELQRREIRDQVRPWSGQPVDPGLVDWLQTEWERVSDELAAAHTELLRAREAAEKIQQGQVEGDQPAVDPVAVQAAQQAVQAAEETGRQVEAKVTRALVAARGDVERGEKAEAQLRRLEAQLATVREQLAKSQTAAGPSPRVAELQRLLADSGDDLVDGSLPDLRARVQTRVDERVQAEEQLHTATAGLFSAAGMVEAATQAVRTAEREEADWARRMDAEVVVRTRAPREALQAADRQAEPARAMFLQIKALLEAADEQLEDSCPCPTCGGRITAGNLRNLQRQAELAEIPATAARVALDRANEAAWGEVKAERFRLGNEVTKLRVELEPAGAAAKSATGAVDLARQTLQLARAAEAEAKGLIAQQTERIARAREELAAAQASTAGTEQATLLERERALRAEIVQVHVPDLSGLRRVLEQTEAQAKRERQQAADQLAESRSALIPMESALTLQREVLRLTAEVDRWETAWRDGQRVERELGPSGMMGAILAELLAPLEALVNEGLDGLGLGLFRVRMLDERGRPVCRPGLERGDRWTPVETLSDGERASVLPVLLPALATLIGGPWRVLLADALERLDSGRRDRFVAQVCRLVREGKIDQAILAGCPDQAPAVEGCTVIPVGK